MEAICSYCYLTVDDAQLFTLVCRPNQTGRFPTLILRSPYVDEFQECSEEEICARELNSRRLWLENGYAVVFQHCRGRGKSTGDCIPYINERKDGLALQAWIREQPFYNGELFLRGGSYTASVHYATAPFAPDIKGAVFECQDSERYNILYRNGQFKIGIHGDWFVDTMYLKNRHPRWNYVKESFHTLPLSDFSKTVFGHSVDAFDEPLRHPDPKDPYWDSVAGGVETRDAVTHANIPILLLTGFYDIYCGGMFTMWSRMDAQTKAKSAFVVHPYDHGGKGSTVCEVFEDGIWKAHCPDFQIRWMNHIRNGSPTPVELGKVTYYSLYENVWRCDDFSLSGKYMTFPLGDGEATYRYNPYAPAYFKGGLSDNFGGVQWQDQPNSRYDILSFFTPEFTKDTRVKGKMSTKLRVKSTCEDTCFYVRISLCKQAGDFGLRDDIQQISNVCPYYVPGEEVELTFCFDEHAFLIQEGERLRIDISSSAMPHYVRHTNVRGLFSEQKTVQFADNTVLCDESVLILPVEEEL